MVKNYLICVSFLVLLVNIAHAQQARLMLPVGHTETISTIQFSPNSKFILTTSFLDNIVKVWEANSGKLVFTLGKVQEEITGGKFSGDGNFIIIRYKNEWTRIWRMQDGKEVLKVKDFPAFIVIGKVRHEDDIKQIGFSSDNKYSIISTGSSVYSYKDQPGESGGELIRLYNYEEESDLPTRITSIVFTPDGENAEIHYAGGDRLKWRLIDGQLIDSVIKRFTQSTAALAKSIVNIEDNNISITDPQNGGKTIRFTGHRKKINQYQISASGKYMVTDAEDSTMIVWLTNSGKAIATFITGNPRKKNLQFNGDETRLVYEQGGQIKIYDIVNSKHLADFAKDDVSMGSDIISYSNDGKYLAWGKDLVVKIWDLSSGTFLHYLESHSDKLNTVAWDNTNNLLLSASWDKYPRVWDMHKGRVVQSFRLRNYQTTIGEATIAVFNKTAGHVISYDVYGGISAKLWNVNDSSRAQNARFNAMNYKAACFSNDGRYLLAWRNAELSIMNLLGGNYLPAFPGVHATVEVALFSPDDKYMAATFNDKTTKVWQVKERKILLTVAASTGRIDCIRFSNDGRLLTIAGNDGTVKIWEIATGKLISEIKTDHSDLIFYTLVSPDGNYIITASHDETFKIWQISNSRLITTIRGHKDQFRFSGNFDVVKIMYSPDGKYFFTSSGGGMTKKWDARSFREMGTSENGGLLQDITADSKRLVTIDNAIIRFFNIEKMELELSYLPVDNTDYLVVDKYNRYDGTEAARKLLYFTCGTEIIGLDQVKDQLWVPNLAERINNGETINAKTLDELNICGLTPQLTEKEKKEKKNTDYQFTITPGRGGLGETVLYVNGIEVQRYKPGQLIKNGNAYELIVKEESLRKYFIDGQKNPVTVKAYTAGNEISSRSVIDDGDDPVRNARTPPNLFALMIGVSDYKGPEMDLAYAAKDAKDISLAVAASAGKFLNTDGKNHVFMYNLTTDTGYFRLPEKAGIRRTLQEIGKQATSNDILLIFFAGHGTTAGENEKKQFYFLTADASKSTATTAPAEVGISIDTLIAWIHPDNIKAQKRILIFDACKSGQAIADFSKLTARDDEKEQEIRAIEKLNEKSGLFILSASASNQSAYELGRIQQGVLTYSLLKVIKQQPDILQDGKYLDVSRWFNAAEKSVGEISKENGSRQQPQLYSNINFNIGVVDAEIMKGIILPAEKPLFTASNFQNSDEMIADDDLELSKLLNIRLASVSSRGTGSKIVYAMATDFPGANTLSGRYTVKGETILVKVNVKQNKVIKFRFELNGTKDKLNELAAAIVDKAAELAK